MAFNDLIVNNWQQLVFSLDGIGIGALFPGPTLQMGRCKAGTASASVTLNADTALITLISLWEVSADGTTWQRATVANNAAYVVQASSGETIAAVISAPDAVYSQRFSRVSVLVGGAAGLADDAGVIGYNFIDSNLV